MENDLGMTTSQIKVLGIGILSIFCMVMQTIESIAWAIKGTSGQQPVAFLIIGYLMLGAMIRQAISTEPCDDLM